MPARTADRLLIKATAKATAKAESTTKAKAKCKNNSNKKTPSEILHKRKPRINHLRVFGCLASAKNFLPTNKMHPRAELGILVGFNEYQNSGRESTRMSPEETHTSNLETYTRWLSLTGHPKFKTSNQLLCMERNQRRQLS
jgi:hypothetical protein